MTNKSGNEPAYPTHVDFQATKVEDYMGLTKREYFAACALQGLLANHTIGDDERCAEWAVQHAGLLISELEKESNG